MLVVVGYYCFKILIRRHNPIQVEKIAPAVLWMVADHAVRDDGSLGQDWLDLTWSELGDGFGVGVGEEKACGLHGQLDSGALL